MNGTTGDAADLDAIVGIARSYFEALYRGDVARLEQLFDEQAWLQAPGARKSRNKWLEAVKDRTAPVDLGEAFEFRILSIDVSGDQAMAKVYSPLLGNRYVDYLGLLREHGEWRIVNKMYADCA